jgi:heat shock protein HtpX
MAISRKKEFLADAGSVELTKDRDAMISALKKISSDSTIEKIQSRNSSVASMFIYDPKKKSKFSSKLKGLFSTHPSLEERIELLEKY